MPRKKNTAAGCYGVNQHKDLCGKMLQSVLPLKQVKVEGAQHCGAPQLGGAMAAWRGRHFVTSCGGDALISAAAFSLHSSGNADQEEAPKGFMKAFLKIGKSVIDGRSKKKSDLGTFRLLP